ncbi:unnamed protein product [Thelazia callipaeda]|uniref:Vesicle-associated membrane protein n=1 Tax=Thelazia callipaeda TaxID=103827 RepID=A0A0N5DCC5_THECL|nr:unnamed protein product [Thelazia callipaeda]
MICSVSYEVTVRRMNCLPDPPEPFVDLEKNVSDEIMKVLTKATDREQEKLQDTDKLDDIQNTKAFAATNIQKVDEKKQTK